MIWFRRDAVQIKQMIKQIINDPYWWIITEKIAKATSKRTR